MAAPLYLGYLPCLACKADDRGHYPSPSSRSQDGECHFCGARIYRTPELRRWFSLEDRFVIQEEPY